MKTVTYDETKWKLVPKESTFTMAVAGQMESNRHSFGTTQIECIYKHMLAAAPPYPESNFVESLDSWIPVSERLPDHDLFVDVTIRSYKNKEYSQRRVNILFCDSKFNIAQKYGEYVSHWMPMPAAPRIKLS